MKKLAVFIKIKYPQNTYIVMKLFKTQHYGIYRWLENAY